MPATAANKRKTNAHLFGKRTPVVFAPFAQPQGKLIIHGGFAHGSFTPNVSRSLQAGEKTEIEPSGCPISHFTIITND